MKAAVSESLTGISALSPELCASSDDLSQLLVTHEVTWSLRDQYCADQYSQLPQPEEYPSMPVTSTIKLLQKPVSASAFDKFDFDKGVNWDD